MNRPEVFRNTVDILVQAFFNETLAAGSCSACAIGNILAESNDTEVVRSDDGGFGWAADKDAAWVSSRAIGQVDVHPELDAPYSTEELTRIEAAFERAVQLDHLEYAQYPDSAVVEDQFRGLMAVVDVLEDIHDVEEETEDVRDQFRNHPALV